MSVEPGNNFETMVACVRCPDGEVEAKFYDNASMWFFDHCPCQPHPYSPLEQAALERRGMEAMERAYDATCARRAAL